MNKLRIAAFLLVLAFLTAVLFTACGGDQPGSSSEGTTGYQYDPEVGMGGDSLGMIYASTYQDRLYYFPALLIRTVGETQFYSWMDEFNFNFETPDPAKRPFDEFNLITFLEDFPISREDFDACLKAEYEVMFSDEELEILHTGTALEKIAAFAGPCAVVVDENIYSAQWIAEHDANELQAVGITSAMLAEKADDWSNWITDQERLNALTQSKTSLGEAELRTKE